MKRLLFSFIVAFFLVVMGCAITLLAKEQVVSCDYHCVPNKIIRGKCYCKIGCGWYKLRFNRPIPECRSHQPTVDGLKAEQSSAIGTEC